MNLLQRECSPEVCHTIRGMSHLDILLPFGLPPPAMAPDLLKELKLPALSILTARAASGRNASHQETFADCSTSQKRCLKKLA